MKKELCSECKKDVSWNILAFEKDLCPIHNQPERSKREDSNCFVDCKRSRCDVSSHRLCALHENCNIEMRCSEHCSNAVREAK